MYWLGLVKKSIGDDLNWFQCLYFNKKETAHKGQIPTNRFGAFTFVLIMLVKHIYSLRTINFNPDSQNAMCKLLFIDPKTTKTLEY